MDHVASGWNGRKSNNILVPDEETNGVSVVGGDLDFFWTKLAKKVLKKGSYEKFLKNVPKNAQKLTQRCASKICKDCVDC